MKKKCEYCKEERILLEKTDIIKHPGFGWYPEVKLSECPTGSLSVFIDRGYLRLVNSEDCQCIDHGEKIKIKFCPICGEELRKSKAILVGGNFDFSDHRPSSVVNKLSTFFENSDLYPTTINGGLTLPDIKEYDLVVWMPNISNETEKNYPKKSKGSVLICSKVMREGYTRIEAVSRIFKMQANAVIAIYKESDKFRFELIDALGNIWANTSDISDLGYNIMRFKEWTDNSIRSESIEMSDKLIVPKCVDIEDFIKLNNNLAEKIQTSVGTRFFGNISTRCSKLFPSAYCSNGVFMSPRNTSKEELKSSDMIYTELSRSLSLCYYYYGKQKPSVDTPIQLEIYNINPMISFMIHGHAFVEGAVETENYYPCGDLREMSDLIPIVTKQNKGVINLKNHGFIIFSNTLDEMKELVDNSVFYYKRD